MSNEQRVRSLAVLALCSGMAAWIAVEAIGQAPLEAERPPRDAFARPRSVPSPADNVPNAARIELGRRLFHEPRLSANGRISCATCHNPGLGFSDGVSLSTAGATGVALKRHTPALWNLAWAPHLFWDGRARSLEEQARFPMSHPDEMASSPEKAALRLAADADYKAAFSTAFGDDRLLSGDLILKAIAAYERTLISPPTRFDLWIAGDRNALSAEEQLGYRLFTGKAQCNNCHIGFAFTDHAFHDIGLAGTDLGRGPVAGLPALAFAFKTPGLRELVWTAPYMHDGSLATLEDVVRHYESGGLKRPTLSRDVPRPFRLGSTERAALVAFLQTLSSERPPRPSEEAWARLGSPPDSPPAVRGSLVSQRDRRFAPQRITVSRGQPVTILNDDTRPHNVRIIDPRLDFNSGVQEPGESVTLRLDTNGLFEAHCVIHPTMRLTIEVE